AQRGRETRRPCRRYSQPLAPGRGDTNIGALHAAAGSLVEHQHADEDEHDHSHGPFVDPSIIRSRAGIKAVSLSLAVLTVTAAAQTAIYVLVLSVALLADLIHNFGDALTAIPLGLAFFMRSARGERWAGIAVVGTIFVSAPVALVQTILRFIHPHTLPPLLWLATAGVTGLRGTEIAAHLRS